MDDLLSPESWRTTLWSTTKNNFSLQCYSSDYYLIVKPYNGEKNPSYLQKNQCGLHFKAFGKGHI